MNFARLIIAFSLIFGAIGADATASGEQDPSIKSTTLVSIMTGKSTEAGKILYVELADRRRLVAKAANLNGDRAELHLRGRTYAIPLDGNRSGSIVLTGNAIPRMRARDEVTVTVDGKTVLEGRLVER